MHKCKIHGFKYGIQYFLLLIFCPDLWTWDKRKKWAYYKKTELGDGLETSSALPLPPFIPGPSWEPEARDAVSFLDRCSV